MSEIYIHPSSYVDEGALIGGGTKIWHFCHIMAGAKIGRDCSIGQNVFIGKDAIIGDGVKIQNNVAVYTGVILEDGVFLGPSMVFTNVSNPRSHINRREEFQTTLVRRGATIGANATIVCGATLGKYAFVGAGAVVTKEVPAHALVYGNPARIEGWMCECGTKLNFRAGADEAASSEAASNGAVGSGVAGSGAAGSGAATCEACGKKYIKTGQTVRHLSE
jgi:UDP-2-acetamido-3-amino-2,3-dideoxy-glucuronate N-acetyltransferase